MNSLERETNMVVIETGDVVTRSYILPLRLSKSPMCRFAGTTPALEWRLALSTQLE
jgi:hypothetical protein